MAVPTFTKTGNKATTPAKLDKAVFGVAVENHELLKSVYVAYLANGRTSAAKAKTRGEIRGGGRKPWRQKGTGRARFGSSRNPIWRGGGITFGPTGNENYSHKLHAKAKRQALRQALSLAASEGKLVVVEAFDLSDAKTATASKFLSKINASGHVLLVVDDKLEMIRRATANLGQVKVVSANYLTVYDLMNADTVVLTKTSIDLIQAWLVQKPVKTTSKEAK